MRNRDWTDHLNSQMIFLQYWKLYEAVLQDLKFHVGPLQKAISRDLGVFSDVKSLGGWRMATVHRFLRTRNPETGQRCAVQFRVADIFSGIRKPVRTKTGKDEKDDGEEDEEDEDEDEEDVEEDVEDGEGDEGKDQHWKQKTQFYTTFHVIKKIFEGLRHCMVHGADPNLTTLGERGESTFLSESSVLGLQSICGDASHHFRLLLCFFHTSVY